MEFAPGRIFKKRSPWPAGSGAQKSETAAAGGAQGGQKPETGAAGRAQGGQKPESVTRKDPRRGRAPACETVASARPAMTSRLSGLGKSLFG